MNAWLFRFFGMPVEDVRRLVSVGIKFRHAEMLGWLVFALMLLGVYSWWTYFRQEAHRGLPRGRKRLLAALRFTLFALLVLLLLQPVVLLNFENRLQSIVAVLVDSTSSMTIRDQRKDDTDLKRAEIALGAIDSLDQSVDSSRLADAQKISRAELVSAVLRDGGKLHLLEELRKSFDVQVYTFGGTPVLARQGADWLASYRPNGNFTPLGDALRDLLDQKRGQPVAGIFLLTDGGNNAGSDPLEAAQMAQQEGVPIFPYGIGITTPRDIIVSGMDAPPIGFMKDEMDVSVRVRGQGLKGQNGHLVLKLGDSEVAAQDVAFDGDEQSVSLKFTPEISGTFVLTAGIAPRDDEASKENNYVSQPVRIIDDKIKVLYIEQTPRWEFRFIQAALLRDRRIKPSFVLLEADPDLSQAEGSPYLPAFPTQKEELFKYDLVIVGDVDPKVFTPDQLSALGEFVSKFGGACLFIAGRHAMPAAYQGSAIEKMLPVEIGPPPDQFAAGSDREIHLALTPAGVASPMFWLSNDTLENRTIWQNLPPIYWDYQAGAPKPGAQVFLEDPDPGRATRFGKMPVFAMQQYGVGQVLFLGTEDLWRWRQNAGVDEYTRLWGQVVQGAALAHLLGGSKRTQLSSDKQEYAVGDQVTIFARLYDESFQPLIQAGGEISIDGGEAQPVALRPVPDQPGMFRANFVAQKAGHYRFFTDGDAKTALEYSAKEVQVEFSGNTAMNEPLLTQMAQASGGKFFREEGLSHLVEALNRKPETVPEVVEGEIWSSPCYFLLMFAVALTEWILRKRSNLR